MLQCKTLRESPACPPAPSPTASLSTCDQSSIVGRADEVRVPACSGSKKELWFPAPWLGCAAPGLCRGRGPCFVPSPRPLHLSTVGHRGTAEPSPCPAGAWHGTATHAQHGSLHRLWHQARLFGTGIQMMPGKGIPGAFTSLHLHCSGCEQHRSPPQPYKAPSPSQLSSFSSTVGPPRCRMEELHGHNASSFSPATVVIFTFQALAGMWINAFIVVVSCTTWFRNKSLSSTEKIVLFLGCFRFWYLCITWIYLIISVLFPLHLSGRGVVLTFAIFLCFLNSSNLWVSACLYAFYCIKIANFRHNFFIYLKANIDRIVPWLLVSSVVLSLINCSPLYKVTDEGNSTSTNFTTQWTFWNVNKKLRERFNSIFFAGTSGFSMAFIMATLSAFLLLFFLCRHKHKMQTSSARNLSTDAHIKAIKSLLSFFLIYCINYIVLISTLHYNNETALLSLLLLVLQYAFPVVHSLILIYSSPKLERIAQRILPCAKCKDCTTQEL
ncbi:taste receptor type 2 member 104-like [Numida meleagris]|uniref:taste receptor type 2 member 104-like n=1 Tax=Numida meleagris TaxID=8996 RepID=UPI000B3DB527|nr:taste receptor type 2 member 104-like [Numida meleagris]